MYIEMYRNCTHHLTIHAVNIMHKNLCLACHASDIQNLQQLLDELWDVTDWMPFGLYLGLSVSTLKQIQKEQQTIKQCQREILLTWWNEPKPTWLKVIQALVNIKMVHLAVKVASNYGKFFVPSKCSYYLYYILATVCVITEIFLCSY